MDTVISNPDVSLSCSASSAYPTSEDSEDYDSISLSESSNSDAVVIENPAAINEKIDIDELKELHVLLIKMLKNLKMDEFVKFLKAKKRTVDRSYRKQNAAVSTFSGVSAVGYVSLKIYVSIWLAYVSLNNGHICKPYGVLCLLHNIIYSL